MGCYHKLLGASHMMLQIANYLESIFWPLLFMTIGYSLCVLHLIYLDLKRAPQPLKQTYCTKNDKERPE